MSEVADLLKRSMVLHTQAKQVTAGQRGNRRVSKPLDRDKLREAYELRKQAITLDPERKDAAWAEEQGNTPVGRDAHSQLMAFYKDQGLDG